MRKRFILVLLAATGLLISGCQTPSGDDLPVPYGTSRVNYSGGLSTNQVAVNIREFPGSDGRITAQAGILNLMPSEQMVQYRFEWFRADGKLIATPASTWVPVWIDGRGIVDVTSTQPTEEATLFRLSLKPLAKP
jgi:uncharacterized protein YcfL